VLLVLVLLVLVLLASKSPSLRASSTSRRAGVAAFAS
jgi:hypothetical protein